MVIKASSVPYGIWRSIRCCRIWWAVEVRFSSGSRVLNLFLCISSLECSDAEQYWISLGNERQSAPQCHLHIIFLTMIRLVEWSWCWFVCQGDFSIRNRFTVKRREIVKPSSWICVVKRAEVLSVLNLQVISQEKKCSELFIFERFKSEIVTQ